jgi:hypothetical protein
LAVSIVSLLDILAERAAQQIAHVLDELVDVEQLRLQRPAPRERQEALREVGADLRRCHGAGDGPIESGNALCVLFGDFEVPGDDRQQIVEIVGDAARQLPQRLHLLRLTQLLLEDLAFRHVAQHDQEFPARASVDRRNGSFDVDGRAVESDQPGFEAGARLCRPGDLAEPVLDALSIFGVQPIQQRPADDLLEAGGAEHAETRAVGESHSFGVMHENRFRHALEEPKLRFVAPRTRSESRRVTSCQHGDGYPLCCRRFAAPRCAAA